MLPLSTLTFFLSWRCSVACEHCGFTCGPGRRGKLSIQRALALIDEAHRREPTLRMIAYSGGEPFLFHDDLLTLMSAAFARGLAGGVVSNCSFAVSDDAVRARLAPLARLGLEELIVSLDEFHLAFVPLENIRRVAHFAMDNGVRLGVNVLALRGRGIRRAEAAAMLGIDAANPPPGGLWIQESSPLRTGRAQRAISPEEQILHPLASFANNPCQYVTRNMVVTPEERVFACCGFGDSSPRGPAALALVGDLRTSSFAECLDRAQGSLVFNTMAEYGPAALLALARNHDDSIELPEAFASNCDICGHISATAPVRKALSRALRALTAKIPDTPARTRAP